MTFDELRRQAYALYGAGEYFRALELVSQWPPNSADEAGELAYWRLCLAARLGQTDQGLAVFSEAVAAGHWYSPAMLRRDEDLISLRGLPEFERLITICDERRAEAQKCAVPSRLTVAPSVPAGGRAPLLLALHGNNGTAGREVDHWRPLSTQGWVVALPQSSQVGGPDRYVWNDRDLAVREVQQHLAELKAEYPVDPGQVVVGGFSMGAGLSVYLGVSGALGARGFIAVGPWLVDVAELRPRLEARAPKGLRGYIVVGDMDTHCYKVSQEVKALLAEFGIPCELEVHPGMGHVYPERFAASLDRAMRFIGGE